MFEVSSLPGEDPALPEGGVADRDEEGEMDSRVDMEQSVREAFLVRRCSWLSLLICALASMKEMNIFN